MGFGSFIEGLAKKAALPRYREVADRYLEISRKFPDFSHDFWLGQLLGTETRIKRVSSSNDPEDGRICLIWMVTYGLKTAHATGTPYGLARYTEARDCGDATGQDKIYMGVTIDFFRTLKVSDAMIFGEIPPANCIKKFCAGYQLATRVSIHEAVVSMLHSEVVPQSRQVLARS